MAMDAETIDPERFRLPVDDSCQGDSSTRTNAPNSKRLPRHRAGEKFLKGPIPWRWLLESMSLGWGPLRLSLILWRLAGVRHSRTVHLAPSETGAVFRHRTSVYRALRRLESARLVRVDRKQGRGPMVTILDLDGGGTGTVYCDQSEIGGSDDPARGR